MKFYAVDLVSGPLYDHEIISPVHLTQFRGEATRGGIELSYSETVAFWTDNRTPLECIHDGNYLPSIFEPAGAHWVISEEVRDILEPFGPCEFLQVKFKKLIASIIQKKGDMSCFPKDDPRKFKLRHGVNLKGLTNDYSDLPVLHKSVGNYYELLLPVTSKLDEEFDDLVPLVTQFDDIHDSFVSKKMFNKYPMLWYGAYLFREDVYLAIEKYLDKDFFLIEEIEI